MSDDPPAPDGVDVYVVDDDEPIRQALGFLLNAAGLSARTFGSALEFLEAAATLPPGCVVTDVRMPGMDGIELARRVNNQGLGHRVIVVTGHGDVPLAVSAMKAGAADFIEKPFNDAVLLGAVRAALETETLASRDDEGRGRFNELLAGLSPREREVLVGVVEGKSNKVIAYALGISPRTVEVHRANMMGKTGARSLSELVRIAISAGI